jgi:hypothetical protein
MNQLFTLEELQMIADLLKDDNSDQAKPGKRLPM